MQSNFKKVFIILAQFVCFILIMAIAQGLKGYNVYILSALLPCAVVWLTVKAINYFAKKKKSYQSISGIGGWLLFFIVTSVFSTLFSWIERYKSLNILKSDFVDLQFFFDIHYITIFIYQLAFLHCVFCVYKIRDNADIRIKLFLMANVLVLFLDHIITNTVMSYHYNVNISANEIYSFRDVLGFIYYIANNTIWYIYFTKSLRVKNTWGYQQESTLPTKANE